jgi:serine/threonine protein kinase
VDDGLDLPQGFTRTLLGQWRIDALLGSGTFGRVYSATHVHDGRRVAVKIEEPSSRLLPYEAKIYDVVNGRSLGR